MIVDGKTLKGGSVIDADVCIIGGGVAGIVTARELLKNVGNIVLIESGGENYSPESQELYSPSKPHNSLYPDPSHTRLRFLGGASNHWENNTSPFDPIDFEKRNWIKNSGWPISYETLKPYYPMAGSYCGVGGDGYETGYWQNKLDLPDITTSSTVIGTGIAKAAIPATRFFHVYGKELVSADNVRIFTNSNVVDVEFNSESKKVDKVFFESAPGVRSEVRARIVLMCCGGIENARLLLHFNKKYSNKLGNAGDNVGRYFMDHPMVRGAHFYPHETTELPLYEGVKLADKVVIGFLKLSEESLRANKINNVRMPLIPATNYTVSDGISSHHIMMDSFRDGEVPDDFGTHLLNFIQDIDMVGEAISRKVFDTKIFDHADEKGAYQIAMMVEQSPHRDNRVTLGDDVDRYGIQKVKIIWEVKEDDKDRLWKALEIVAQEVGAKGLGRVRLLKERSDRVWGDQMGFGHHHMGTTRMAASEVEGVVDSNLKVFGTENFYMSGSSVFPTGGHVPPTLTIVALSIRLAKLISERLEHDQ
ncbi:choline dehydrogenase [Gammaproteobacteria bacterium 42_54_T18]|nr:choline dehydrogenase [Gammaproteobacteria bacterium 42_54_T18]